MLEIHLLGKLLRADHVLLTLLLSAVLLLSHKLSQSWIVHLLLVFYLDHFLLLLLLLEELFLNLLLLLKFKVAWHHVGLRLSR